MDFGGPEDNDPHGGRGRRGFVHPRDRRKVSAKVREERQSIDKPAANSKLLLDRPDKPGFHGGSWPFDTVRWRNSASYRNALDYAINHGRGTYSPYWIHFARRLVALFLEWQHFDTANDPDYSYADLTNRFYAIVFASGVDEFDPEQWPEPPPDNRFRWK